jgi:hypothetical protein
VSPHFASYHDSEGEAHPFFKFRVANIPVFESLVIHVLSSDETLQYGVDESYTLNGKREGMEGEEGGEEDFNNFS